MAYLIFLLALALIFAGFLALTYREGKRGRRYFEASRGELDARVARAEFVVTHVDFAAFVRANAVQTGERVAHDVAHAVLQAVRWSERQLTRAVRALRARREATNGAVAADVPPPQASEYARTINDFKQELRAQRENGAADAAPDSTTGAVD